MLSVNAPGKIILIGEYAVLEGAHSVVAAVDKYSRVKIEPHDEDFFYFHAPNLQIPDILFRIGDDHRFHFLKPYASSIKNKLGYFLSTFRYVYDRLRERDIVLKPLNITVETSQFYDLATNRKFGLGSSAAMTVSLVTTFFEYGREAASELQQKLEIFLKSLDAHRKAQGNLGSGIDIAASTFGGIMDYTMPTFSRVNDSFPRHLTMPEDLHIIPVWTGTTASTRNLVGSINDFKDHDFEQYTRLMDQLIEHSDFGTAAFIAGDVSSFLEKVQDFYHAQDELGTTSGTSIISEEHRELASLVETSGGIYKPSGAGGGDIGIAFADSVRLRDKIRHTIADSRFELLDITIDFNGVQVDTDYEFSRSKES